MRLWARRCRACWQEAAVASVTAVSAVPAVALVEFGIPVGSPLRTPVRISGMRINGPGPLRNLCASDFIDRDPSPFDPLDAATAGMVHFGERGGARTPLAPRCTQAMDVGPDRPRQRAKSHVHPPIDMLAKEGQRSLRGRRSRSALWARTQPRVVQGQLPVVELRVNVRLKISAMLLRRHQTGQHAILAGPVNIDRAARDAGWNHSTAENYARLLEAVFLIQRLLPGARR